MGEGSAIILVAFQNYFLNVESLFAMRLGMFSVRLAKAHKLGLTWRSAAVSLVSPYQDGRLYEFIAVSYVIEVL